MKGSDRLPERLAATFLQGRQLDVAGADAVKLGKRLTELLQQAESTWPGFDLDPDVVVRYWAERVEPGADLAALDALDGMHTSDLYLALACLTSNAAIRAFEQSFIAQVPSLLRGVETNPASVEEVQQTLRVRFFAADAEHLPKIAEYSGRGPLAGWVRVAAVRTSLNLRRSEPTRASVSEIERKEAASDDTPLPVPEVAYLKRRYRLEFSQALKVAMAQLTSRDRALLRLHFIEGVTLPDLAALHQAGRSTVARWLAQARHRVLAAVKQELMDAQGIRANEVDSLVFALKSDLDGSIADYLIRMASRAD